VEQFGNLLTDFKAEELRREAAPTGFCATWGGSDMHCSLVMVDMMDDPGLASQQKRAYLLNQGIHKGLL